MLFSEEEVESTCASTKSEGGPTTTCSSSGGLREDRYMWLQMFGPKHRRTGKTALEGSCNGFKLITCYMNRHCRSLTLHESKLRPVGIVSYVDTDTTLNPFRHFVRIWSINS